MELEEHQNSHTGEKPFECDVCKARFNRRSTLWNHKRIHSDTKPFNCPICEMTFKWKNSLKCHREMHMRKNETAVLEAEAAMKQVTYAGAARRSKKDKGGKVKKQKEAISVNLDETSSSIIHPSPPTMSESAVQTHHSSILQAALLTNVSPPQNSLSSSDGYSPPNDPVHVVHTSAAAVLENNSNIAITSPPLQQSGLATSVISIADKGVHNQEHQFIMTSSGSSLGLPSTTTGHITPHVPYHDTQVASQLHHQQQQHLGMPYGQSAFHGALINGPIGNASLPLQHYQTPFQNYPQPNPVTHYYHSNPTNMRINYDHTQPLLNNNHPVSSSVQQQPSLTNNMTAGGQPNLGDYVPNVDFMLQQNLAATTAHMPSMASAQDQQMYMNVAQQQATAQPAASHPVSVDGTYIVKVLPFSEW